MKISERMKMIREIAIKFLVGMKLELQKMLKEVNKMELELKETKEAIRK